MNLFSYNTEDLASIMPSANSMGKRVTVNRVSSINSPLNHSIIFAKKEKWITEYEGLLKDVDESLLILENDIDLDIEMLGRNNQILISENPRLDFAIILDIILKKNNKEKKYKSLDNNVVIGEDAVIGENVALEPFTFIDCNVIIGCNCIIKTGARIRSNVIIGDNVIIGENTVIGAQGFGVEMDRNGQMHRIPHLGGVVIEDNVEVGALVSVVSGTMNPTVISQNTMIDDLVHIAHNCTIGGSTMITACTQISGSAKVGEKCYFAPNSTVRNGIRIGKKSFIGQASSVTKDLDDNSVVGGNPAMDMDKLKKLRKLIKESIKEHKGDKE